MKRNILAVTAAAILVLVATSARAVDVETKRPYANCVSLTVPSASGEVIYFDRNTRGATTSDPTQATAVDELVIVNTHTGQINLRVYGAFEPGYDGVFSDDANDDYVLFLIPAQSTTVLDKLGTIYGWNLITDPGNPVYLYGRNVK